VRPSSGVNLSPSWPSTEPPLVTITLASAMSPFHATWRIHRCGFRSRWYAAVVPPGISTTALQQQPVLCVPCLPTPLQVPAPCDRAQTTPARAPARAGSARAPQPPSADTGTTRPRPKPRPLPQPGRTPCPADPSPPLYRLRPAPAPARGAPPAKRPQPPQKGPLFLRARDEPESRARKAILTIHSLGNAAVYYIYNIPCARGLM